MIVCSKCGYDNELGRIFCHSCGAKLNLTEIKSPSQGGKSLAKKSRAGSGKIVSRLVFIVILAVVVVGLSLAFQVPNIRPISTSSEDLVLSDKKRAALDDLLVQRQPNTITISEGELNSFIQTLGFENGSAGTMQLVPTKFQLELGDGVVTAVFLGKLHIAGSVEKQIYLSYTGVPTVENGHFVFKPTGGAFGALPMSPWLLVKAGIFDQCFAKLFVNLDKEKQVLDSLSSISVTSQSVVLNYQPH
ncbi:MAG: zinc-ribbon domain-containing protein [Verrucomicrobiia bacterium]